MRWSNGAVASCRLPVASCQFQANSYSQCTVDDFHPRVSYWALRIVHWVLSTRYGVLAGLALLYWLTPSTASAAAEKQISIYSPVAIYSLPVVERSGRDYVGLLELLEPLGRVNTDTNGRSLKLRYNSIDAEFSAGKTRAKIHGHEFDFAAPFLIENSRGLLPVSSLGAFLPRFLGTPVNFHESSRRVFIGDVAIQPSFHLDNTVPPRLLLSFSAAVNPTISSEPGKLRMTFSRDPVVSPGSQSITFDNQIITHANYSENNGDAELEVDATAPLMAAYSSDQRTITLTSVQAPAAASSGQHPTPPPAVALSPSDNKAAHATTSSGPNRILAVVDPAHGGDERGAALSDKIAEKDVTLGFARLLRHELETRGFAVNLLRNGDNSLTLDQRAEAANVAGAGIYISVHAISQGNGARVYTALLPAEGESKGVFHAWNSAQSPVLQVSRIVSAAVVAELQKQQLSAQERPASLRPLNNVVVPAIAVELAPGPDGINDLISANYQQRVAAAIADGVASVRGQLQVQP